MRRLVRSALLILLASGSLVLAMGGGLMWRTGHRILSVQSGSMVPVFWPGEAVVTSPVPQPRSLRPGDVVSYRSPANANVIVSHRVIGVDAAHGVLMTRGDHVDRADLPVPYSAVIGRVVYIVPMAGRVIDFVHRPAGLAAVVYLPAVGLMIVEVRRLGRQLSVVRYRRVL